MTQEVYKFLSNKNYNITPQKLGFLFEEYIHTYKKDIKFIRLREKDIKAKYKKFITGIDEMFIFCDKIVFIQAKWLKTKPTVSMVQKFAYCVNLMKEIIPNKRYLSCFVSSHPPTRDSQKLLDDKQITYIHNTSMNIVVEKLFTNVLDFFKMDCEGDIIMT